MRPCRFYGWRLTQFTSVFGALGFTAFLMAGVAHSADWPQFRGPAGNGCVEGPSHPVRWGSSENLAWSADVAGSGWSSPIVIGDRVFVTSAVLVDSGKPKGFTGGVTAMVGFSRAKPPAEPVSFEVLCFSLSDGQQLWQRRVVSRKAPFAIHPSNTYATESPATDGQSLFVYFAAVGVVACLDLDGELQWTKEIGAYRTSNNFGSSSSLALHENLLFVQCDNDENSFLLAMATDNGQEVWRKERKGSTSWSSPVLWKNNIRTELVVCGSGFVTSHDPQTGDGLWELSGVGGSFTASPAFDAERIYLGNSGPASRGPLVAVRAGAAGALNLKSSVAEGISWVQRNSGPGMASPVAYRGHVYVVSRGILSCHDAESGKRLYQQRLPSAKNISASLWASQDKLFVLDESGKTFVIAAGPKYQLLGKNLIDGLYWSTTSVGNDSLLLREATQLHCIRKRSDSLRASLD